MDSYNWIWNYNRYKMFSPLILIAMMTWHGPFDIHLPTIEEVIELKKEEAEQKRENDREYWDLVDESLQYKDGNDCYNNSCENYDFDVSHFDRENDNDWN